MKVSKLLMPDSVNVKHHVYLLAYWVWGMEVGERESIYPSLHCQHQNDSCIKVGSDQSF